MFFVQPSGLCVLFLFSIYSTMARSTGSTALVSIHFCPNSHLWVFKNGINGFGPEKIAKKRRDFDKLKISERDFHTRYGPANTLRYVYGFVNLIVWVMWIQWGSGSGHDMKPDQVSPNSPPLYASSTVTSTSQKHTTSSVTKTCHWHPPLGPNASKSNLSPNPNEVTSTTIQCHLQGTHILTITKGHQGWTIPGFLQGTPIPEQLQLVETPFLRKT